MKLGNPKLLAAVGLLVAVGLVAWLNRPLPVEAEGPTRKARRWNCPTPPRRPRWRRPSSRAIRFLSRPKPSRPARPARRPSVDLPSGPNKYAPEVTYSAKEYREAGNGPQLEDCAAAKDPNDLCAYTQPRFLTD